MAIVLIDSADGYDLDSDEVESELKKKWDTAGSDSHFRVEASLGRFGGDAINIRSNPFPPRLGKSFGSNSVIVGFVMKEISVGNFLFFDNPDDSPDCNFATAGYLRMEADNTLSLYNRNDTRLAGSAEAGLALPRFFVHVEVLWDYDVTPGVEVRVNGEQWFTHSSPPTSNDPCDNTINVAFRGFFGDTLIDDVYIIDRDDAAGATDFLGDTRVEFLQPTSDVVSDWVPQGGSSNFSEVDDLNEDEDSTYNSSDTIADLDLFEMSDLTTSTATFHGVQFLSNARETSATTRNLQNVIHASGSTQLGPLTAFVSSNTYDSFRSIFETDPSGSTWTAGSVDGVRSGYSG